ncbi:DNA repair endonuclease rad2 [Fusarium albosuccineum]|uniref:DNA repair endonuclease rad2 n=1 Tax=Fusarium albosuccineum TaxID=1237068 RepID=A0A8H4PD86_9HYPO|nr:DNA repair endonuclease rad2 [Fusarium albosuccineum]
MGIKGIYQEIGEGKRIALVKLAAESLVKKDRPLRIAVDIAIWQFQNQAAQGGTNPAIRTLFYRLVRLLAAPVEPVFVFDGPYKPKIKRNKRSGRGDSLSNAHAKRLIRLFGFPIHDAPGEAEAECALLQRHGIVDAVLSEDVDTLMFGCTRMIRQWSPQSKRQTTPTHVSLFDTKEMKLAGQGLDREGMVLVALMSGGDYDPDGIPGCGIKVAVEAAKAGYGKTLCQLKASDEQGAQAWRDSLIHELRTNESGFFKRRNKALVIPSTFPDTKILRYYTHPVVSPESSLGDIREKLHKKGEIQFGDLREFTREVFDWDYRIGAIKFVRVLSHAVLINKMQDQGCDHVGYVKGITGFRSHVTNDNVPEVRIQHIPLDIIPIDLSKEADEKIVHGRDGLALNSDDDVEEAENIEDDTGSKSSKSKPFDPSERLSLWVLEVLAKRTVPEVFTEAEMKHMARERALLQKKNSKTRSKPVTKKGMPAGALDKYVRATKAQTAPLVTTKEDTGSSKPQKPSTGRHSRRLRIPPPLEPSKQPISSTSGSPVRQTTPWTLASSQATPRKRDSPGGQQAIVITSSPFCAADSPPPSPSPQPKSGITGSQQFPGTVRAILASDNSPKRVNKTKTTHDYRFGKPTASFQASQPAKMKQTSMDIFTTRSNKTISSQASFQKPAPLLSKTLPQPVVNKEYDGGLDSDDPDDFVPLSSLLSRAPASPSKRHQKPQPTNRSTSPSPAPARKKKLLVPRASAVGFFEEIEVDAEERDERLARETATLERKGIRTGAVRMSDVGFIDLTQED